MDKTGGNKKRVFHACRCNKDDVPPGAATNKKKSKISGNINKRPSYRVVPVATTTTTTTKTDMKKENENNCGGTTTTTAETTASAALPATSSNESVVYLGTFGNSICCSIIDLTSCSPTCLVVKRQDDRRSINNKRRIPISATASKNKTFQEHHRHHHYHPSPPPPPLILRQGGGEFHQSFRHIVRPKSYTLAEHQTRNKPSSSSGPPKCRAPPPKKHDYCNVEPGCLCTVLNKMPLDLSFSVNEDTVLDHILDTEQQQQQQQPDLVPLFEDLNVSQLVLESLITTPFSVKGLLEMYRVNVTDTFSSWV